MTACNFGGNSRFIAMIDLSLGSRELDNYDTLGDADGPQVAVPAFDRVLFGVAVAAEQLHAVQPDLHALVGTEPLGERRFAGERLTLLGARCPAPGDQPQSVQLDG